MENSYFKNKLSFFDVAGCVREQKLKYEREKKVIFFGMKC